jgi:hypothetical protein
MRGRKNRAGLPVGGGELLYRDVQDETPERKLLAAVLLQAWYDCANKNLHIAFTAFKWAVDRSPMFNGICHELGASPVFVAQKFRDKFGDRFRLVGEA